MNKTYVIHKDALGWAFEEMVDGKIISHHYTARRRAINSVLKLNPGKAVIILSFQDVEKSSSAIIQGRGYESRRT